MTDKMTIMKALDYVLTNCELPEDVREKIKGVQTTYGKRSSGKRLSSVNAEMVDRIYECLDEGVEYTVSDIIHAVPELNGMSTQKVAPMVKALCADGRMNKGEGRTSKYTKA